MKKMMIVLVSVIIFILPINSQTATAPSGSGTSIDPYVIANLNNLYWLATQVNSSTSFFGKYFVQNADIDASGTASWFSGAGWLPIGDANAYTLFDGSYDGQNHKIDGLFIDRSSDDYVALFGGLISGGTIENLGLTNVSITGQNYISALVAYLEEPSTITNCYSTGSISGSFYGAGILADNWNTGNSLNQCYSSCTISCEGVVGGLVGNNMGVISNSYATGNVTASGNYDGCGHAGGLIAYNTGTVDKCYAIGLVTCVYTITGYYGGLVGRSEGGSSTNSFWDTQTTGQTTNPDGGTGKTTSEMQTESTFTGAGWDFTASTGVWEIIGSNYPQLQDNPDPALPVELVTFAATANETEVLLNWQTATEVNNYGFEVQKSEVSSQNSEGSFKKIGFVQGNGTSNSPKEYSFVDPHNPNFDQVSYRLKQIDNDGTFNYSKTITVDLTNITTVEEEGIPKEYSLSQNYPNPFNPSTTISYQVPKKSHVKLEVYNSLGQLVATLANSEKNIGEYQVQFTLQE